MNSFAHVIILRVGTADCVVVFFFQAEDGIRGHCVTGVQTCALPISTFPSLLGVKTGHTAAAGWSEVAAARGRGLTVYATLLGSPSRSERNDDLAELLAWGLDQYRVVPAIGNRVYATVALPYGKARLELRAARPLLTVARVGRPLTEKVVAAASVSLPVERGDVLGRVEIWAGKRLVGRRDLVASRTVNRPGPVARVSWYAGRTAHKLAGLF